jgi:hypothetical protein
MKPRSGTTLVEVLVAIFVMGIGLLALLTLFPLGALNMAQAIQDDLATHAQGNAHALAEALDLRNDANVVGAYNNPDPGGTYGVKALTAANYPGYDGPSFPVYVDGYGALALSAQAQNWVGDLLAATFTVPRRSPGVAANVNNLPFYFTLLDDIKFLDSGVPDTGSGQVEREGGISWAYLMRRPRLSVTSAVDVSVVVYARRPLRTNKNLNPNEATYTATFHLASNTVDLTWNTANGQTVPQLRPGGWILDGTVETRGNYPWPHGFLYRVSDVSDVTTVGVNGSVTLTIATPFREFDTSLGQNPTGTVIILDGVAAVYEKRTGWQP